MKTGKPKLLALIIKQIPFEEMMARRIPDINYLSFLAAKWKCWSLKVQEALFRWLSMKHRKSKKVHYQNIADASSHCELSANAFYGNCWFSCDIIKVIKDVFIVHRGVRYAR